MKKSAMPSAAPHPVAKGRIVKVEFGALPARRYDIVIGDSLLSEAGTLIQLRCGARDCLIVTDTNAGPLYVQRCEAVLAAAGHKVLPSIAVPAGEASKDYATLQKLCDRILKNGADRKTLMIALGGGVVGDLAGLAAALCLRGLEIVQIPTTLVAQVDSAVGGKTAIDTPQGKNLVGAFHQPVLVLADIDALATLPARELRAGYAEVVKYGLIRDPGFFAWLEAHGTALLAGDAAARGHAVTTSLAIKAAVVGADEREAGERQILNLGHSFGHALEAEAGFGATLLHGEAVALGMCLAFDLAVRLGHCPAGDAARAKRHLAAAGLATALAALPAALKDPARLLAQMRKDKKVKAGRITLVLPRRIGEVFVTGDVAPETLLDFLAAAAGEPAPAAAAPAAD
jgi:3-dehydroquinate synthase